MSQIQEEALESVCIPVKYSVQMLHIGQLHTKWNTVAQVLHYLRDLENHPTIQFQHF